MRTNIEIYDTLLQRAMKATGRATKRATVEEALRTLVRLRKDVAWLRKFVHNDEVTSSPLGVHCPYHCLRDDSRI